MAVGNVDAHVTAPAAQAIEPGPDAGGHGHLDVPRDERRRRWPRCRACAASCDGGIVARAVGLRGGPERRRRHLRLVRRQLRPARATTRRRARAGWTCTSTCPSSPGAQAVGEHGLVALDWHSGNRSVLVDHELSGVIVGLTLATRPEDVYRALIEATAFGTRMILEAFADGRRARAGAVRRRRAAQEPRADADLRRRHAPPAAPDRAPSRARRSARRCTPRSPPAIYADIHAAAAAMGKVSARRLHARRRRAPTPTTRCTRTTAPARPLRPRRRRRDARACARSAPARELAHA